MIGLFITGTDTGVGKTYVTAAVARHLHRKGAAVDVCKPIATGGDRTPDGILSDDTRQLALALGKDGPAAWRRITEWTFSLPAAPPVAARHAGQTLDLESIVNAVQRRSPSGSLLLVEGVGGLLCPLTDRETVADLVMALDMPLVIVARRSLGTLNHTLLTVEAARARKLAIAGVVVNETTPCRGLAEESNVEELRRRLTVPLLAVVPHGSTDGEWLTSVDWRHLAEKNEK